MAETPPTTAEQLIVLKEELALAQAISEGRDEPAYRYISDPPGGLVIQAYLQQRSAELAAGQAPPIFHVELPPLGQTPLVEILSRPLDLPMTGKWKDPSYSYFAEERVAEQLRTRQIELTILSNAHYLSSRRNAVEWLVCFFRQHLNHAPLVLLGESAQMDALLLWNATAWVIRRFQRIRLPGEPEEQRVAPDQFLT
jgi:hypothetical protein